ncbi:two-component system response regulator [Spirochaeta dissipatitropha]
MLAAKRILLIDNNLDDLAELASLLEAEGYETRSISRSQDVFDSVHDFQPDLLLLYTSMPETDGYEICSILKKNPETAGTPVIFLSRQTAVKYKIKAFQSGGVDYISKPYQNEELLARIQTQLNLLETRRKLEQAHTTMAEWSSTLEQHVADRTREILQNERKLHFLAMHDSLTELPNRHAMHEALTRITSQSPGQSAAILYIDLDDFAEINRSFGHHTGDELIELAADRLNKVIIEWRSLDINSSVLYRCGEDEFVVLIEEIDGEASVIQAGEALLAAMQEPFLLLETEMYLPANIGFAIFPDDSSNEEQLLQCAQMAVNEAKKHIQQSHRMQRFQNSMAQNARERIERIHALRAAILNEDLFLDYQPKVNLNTREIIGAEALLRWKPDGKTLLPPPAFIPLAEQTGMIHELGQLIISMVCRQIRSWDNQNLRVPPVAINISPVQLVPVDFADSVLKLLKAEGIHPSRIILEITETAFMEDRKRSIYVLQKLRKAGVMIHLDDFGTGYSSFSYLSDLPIDCVKIDKSFLDQCVSCGLTEHDESSQNVNHRTILEGIITLSRGLKLNTIAEGIETPDQVLLLQELGCINGQGFYFYRPLSPELLAEKLKAHHKSVKTEEGVIQNEFILPGFHEGQKERIFHRSE